MRMSQPIEKVGTLDEFSLLRNIGHNGCTGEVMLGRSTDSDHCLALKIVKPRLKKDIECRKFDLKNEFELGRELAHPRIVQVFFFREEGTLSLEGKEEKVAYAGIEYAANGDITNCMLGTEQDLIRLSENAAKFYFRQFLEGYNHLASKDVAHRDIKPENLLVDSAFDLKIADLGFARKVSEAGEQGQVGTLKYMAPEVLMGGTYDPFKADVFSAGCAFFFFLTASKLFNFARSNDQWFDSFVKDPSKHFDLITQNYTLSTQAKDFLISMLEVEPSDRLSFEALLNHPFMNSEIDEKSARNELKNNIRESKNPIVVPSIDSIKHSARRSFHQGSISSSLNIKREEMTLPGSISVQTMFISDLIEVAVDQILEEQDKKETIKIEVDQRNVRIVIEDSDEVENTIVSLDVASTSEDTFSISLVKEAGDFFKVAKLKKQLFESFKKIRNTNHVGDQI